MAKRNYLVEGLSGAGKSSVYEELIRRGYKAISTDRAWKYHADPDTGLPGGPIHHHNSMWDQQKAVSELESPEPEVLFVCGSSRNRDRFLPYFTKIFNLRIDDDTMRRRLQERTNNEYGKQPEEVELMLRLNRSDEKPAGAIDVDATQPLNQVVDELLRLANCRTVTSDSEAAARPRKAAKTCKTATNAARQNARSALETTARRAHSVPFPPQSGPGRNTPSVAFAITTPRMMQRMQKTMNPCSNLAEWRCIGANTICCVRLSVRHLVSSSSYSAGPPRPG